jgi:translation initiation factor 3 subunit G
MLYKKRMERELMRAKGLLKEAEKPPGEEVRVLLRML